MLVLVKYDIELVNITRKIFQMHKPEVTYIGESLHQSGTISDVYWGPCLCLTCKAVYAASEGIIA